MFGDQRLDIGWMKVIAAPEEEPTNSHGDREVYLKGMAPIFLPDDYAIRSEKLYIMRRANISWTMRAIFLE